MTLQMLLMLVSCWTTNSTKWSGHDTFADMQTVATANYNSPHSHDVLVSLSVRIDVF